MANKQVNNSVPRISSTALVKVTITSTTWPSATQSHKAAHSVANLQGNAITVMNAARSMPASLTPFAAVNADAPMIYLINLNLS